MKTTRSIGLLITVLTITTVAFAQKLPEKQLTGVWAPANVKVDGKVNEWDGGFKAFNSATGIYYTMANDDKFLYLAIKAKDSDVINRIVDGGITLSVKEAQSKDDAEFSVTYPVTKEELVFRLRSAKGETPNNDQKTIDTLMQIYNKRLDLNCKSIALKTKNGADTLSVFNDNGIKASGYFDSNKNYNLEIAIALNSPGIPQLNGKIAYHLIVNGAIRWGKVEAIIPPTATPEQVAAIERSMALTQEHITKMMAPTDFRAEYVFPIKK